MLQRNPDSEALHVIYCTKARLVVSLIQKKPGGFPLAPKTTCCAELPYST
jgi:hypothetical protein